MSLLLDTLKYIRPKQVILIVLVVRNRRTCFEKHLGWCSGNRLPLNSSLSKSSLINICTQQIKSPNAQKVRVFVLQNIHLAIFGQLMTTAGWGPSHTVERGLCRVTWVSKLFVVGHLPNSARSIHNNLLDFLCAYYCGKSYRWVHGKVCKATLDGDEGEGANYRQWLRAEFRLVEAI